MASLDDAISYLQSFARSPAQDIAQEIFIEDLSSLSPSDISPSERQGSDIVEHSFVPRKKEAVREILLEALASLAAVRRVS